MCYFCSLRELKLALRAGPTPGGLKSALHRDHPCPFASICVHSRFRLSLGCASLVSSGPPPPRELKEAVVVAVAQNSFREGMPPNRGFVPPASSCVAGTTETSCLPGGFAIRAARGLLLLLLSRVETRATSWPYPRWTEVRAPQEPAASICVHSRPFAVLFGPGLRKPRKFWPTGPRELKEAVVVAVAQDSFGEGMPPKQGVRSSG